MSPAAPDTLVLREHDVRHPRLWAPSMDIVVWLRSLGLGKYEAAFRENEIDETVLPSLTHEHLEGAWRHGARAPAEAARRHCRSA